MRAPTTYREIRQRQWLVSLSIFFESSVPKTRIRKKRLTQDDIYNTLELAYQLDGFVMQIDIFPSLLLVLGLKECIKGFNDILRIKRDSKEFFIYWYYIRNGKLLHNSNVKNFLFKTEPTVPLSFLIHEKKDQKFHERFLTILAEHCPNLKQKTIFGCV